MVRFGVDEVAPAKHLLPTCVHAERYRDALCFGGDATERVIDHGAAHALMAAVGIAFAQHRPLVLSPDAVWLTIAQGVAQHVRLNAEQLRGRLVRHDGRKRLMVQTDSVPTDAAGWADAAARFRELLAAEIGDGPARLFECDFSTSTDVDRVASQVVLFDAYSPYFSLWMYCICGIPSITLTGTVDDWRRIRERIDVIAELDLDGWCRSLRPIADHFVRAARGKPDVAFWRRIYNPQDAYGGERITGWITRLYPYVMANGALAEPNPMLELSLGEPKNQKPYSAGLPSDSFPQTMSRVTVHVVDRLERDQARVALVAGVGAVAQDADGGLRPIACWHLERGTVGMEEVSDRMAREHRLVPRDVSDEKRRFVEGPPDLVALYAHMDGATLFAGARAWHVRGPRECDSLTIERAERFSIRWFVDLPERRGLCAAYDHDSGRVHWIVCRVEPSSGPAPYDIDFPSPTPCHDTPAEIPVLAGSLASILEAALDSGGDIAHLEVGRFADVLR